MTQWKRHTDDRFSLLIRFHRDFTVSNQERKVEKIFNGLTKVIGINDELEEIDLAGIIFIWV